MYGLRATVTITRFTLKRIPSWMLTSSLKSKYHLISSLVSGQPIFIICFNSCRPSSSSVFLPRSARRSLVIARNSAMLTSSMDLIRYSSRLTPNTSDFNSSVLGLRGRNVWLSVSSMNSFFPGLYTIFKVYHKHTGQNVCTRELCWAAPSVFEYNFFQCS